MGEIKKNKVKSWVLYRKNSWDIEQHLLMAARGTQPLCCTLTGTTCQPPDSCNPALLSHIDPDNLLSVFLPNCSSAKLFFYFLLPSLHLQPQSSLPTLPQHGNLYSGWQMSLPVSLLRPYYFLSAATYCYYIRIVIFSPHLFWI